MRFNLIIVSILFLSGCTNDRLRNSDTGNQTIESTVFVNGNPIDLNKKLDKFDSLLILNSKDLRILRNEIFARKGLIFRSEDLNDYFKSYNWYNPKYNDPNEVTILLSETDNYNISYIKKIEELKKNEINKIISPPKTTFVVDSQKISNSDDKYGGIKRESINKTFFIGNDTVNFVIEKLKETYYSSQVEGNHCIYKAQITPISPDYKNLYRELSGSSNNFENIDILYGQDFICKLTNFECCGGATFNRLYSLANESVFMQYNQDYLIKIGNNKPTEWIGFCFDPWGLEWEKYLYSNRDSMTNKGFRLIGALIYSSEINGVYESLQVYKPKNLKSNSISIIPRLNEFKDENNFSIIISYLDISEELLFMDKKYIPRELNSNLKIIRHNKSYTQHTI